MNLKLNPYYLISDDLSEGISTLDGQMASFSPSQIERLSSITSSPQTLENADIELIEAGVVIPESHLTQLHNSVIDSVEKNLQETASLIVMPTEKCNFRCTYCYEKFEKGRMKPETVSALKQYISNTVPKFKTYQLAWFGGEPLLHPDLVAEVSAHFKEVSQAHGVHSSVSVTTNGYLLKDGSLKELSNSGMDVYHITLDGPKSLHDKQRVGIKKQPTYERIFDNMIKILDESDSRIVLRVNVQISGSDSSDLIQQWLTQEIVPTFESYGDRVDYYIVPIWDATTTGIEGICLSKLVDFQRVAKLKEAALNAKGSSLKEELASLLAKPGSLSCYAGTPNSFVIGADGAVYKCSVAVDLPENQIGKLTGSGHIELDAENHKHWITENAVTDSNCNSCNFARSCQGVFCPLVRIQTQQPPCPTEKRFAYEIVNQRFN